MLDIVLCTDLNYYKNLIVIQQLWKLNTYLISSLLLVLAGANINNQTRIFFKEIFLSVLLRIW